MIVTDKKFYMHEKLIEKMQLGVSRCMEKDWDSVFIVDGDEGAGKSCMAIQCAYYCSYISKMLFDVSHIYYDVDKLIEHAGKTKRQIFIWDEAALSGLSTDWYSKSQLKLIKFLMISRANNHLYFFCIPKIMKLKDYLATDRSVGLIHVYAKNEMQRGRFVYFRKQSKISLIEALRKRNKFAYQKYYDFNGKFVDAAKKIIDLDVVNELKSQGIVSVSHESKFNLDKAQVDKFKYLFAWRIPKLKKITVEEVCKAMEINEKTLYSWRNLVPPSLSPFQRNEITKLGVSNLKPKIKPIPPIEMRESVQ